MSLGARLVRLLKLVVGIVVAVLWRRPPRKDVQPPEEESPTVERRLPDDGPRTALVVAALLALAAAGLGAFVALYVAHPSTQALGVAAGLGVVFLGLALAIAGKALVPQEKAAGTYHEFGDGREQAALERTIRSGGEGVTRRKLLVAAGDAVAAAGGAAALVPLASLGPNPPPFATPWGPGTPVVDAEGRAVAAGAVIEGAMTLGFPEGASRDDFGAPLIIVRLPIETLDLPPERLAGAPEGILAFSRICPHAGCAISMYRTPNVTATQPSPALVCPCHYSTFDPRRGGALDFGPAGRPLPQLPLRIGAGRRLEAAGDFFERIGPSYGTVREGVPGSST